MSEPRPFNPAAARLDNETEAALYALYRAYFLDAEARFWNVWDTIPWQEAYPEAPSDALTDAVLSCYGAELFLPDYMTVMLMHTRSSRGRAWYVTHWCYEEGKHLLALGEWLTRHGVFTDEELQNRGNELLAANRYEPAAIDAVALFVDAILYETQEESRYRELRRVAESENDAALIVLCDWVLGDEATQKKFFADSLAIIARRHPGKVESAVDEIAATQADPEAARRVVRGAVNGSGG